MKPLLTILMCLTFALCGCEKIELKLDTEYISPDVYSGSTNALKHLPKGDTGSIYADFVLGSPTAVSNAITFCAPPEGWDIVCDGSGHYAPRKYGYVFDFPLSNVRTNYFQATVAAWRNKEIADTPLPPHPNIHWSAQTISPSNNSTN